MASAKLSFRKFLLVIAMAAISITGARSGGVTTDQTWFPGGRLQQFGSFAGRTMRSAGSFTNMWLRVTANAAAQSVVDFRINLIDTAILLTIPATTTGEFEDTGSEAVIAGDEVRVDLDHGDQTNSLTISLVNLVFSATTNTVCVPLMCNSGSLSTASTSFYYPLAGGAGGGSTTTEADAQYKAKTAGTAKNLFANVDSNSRSTATTADFRINGSSGTQTVSITASTTGVFEDTTHTDSVAIDDLINYRIALGTGTGSIRLAHFSDEFETTNTAWPLVGGEPAGNSLSTSTTYFYTVGGGFFQSTTELNTRAEQKVAFTWSKLACYVPANTIADTSTLRARINGSNGNQVVSITTLATGYFEDISNTDAVAATDEINYSFVMGAVGTALTLSQLASLGQITVPAGGAINIVPLLIAQRRMSMVA